MNKKYHSRVISDSFIIPYGTIGEHKLTVSAHSSEEMYHLEAW